MTRSGGFTLVSAVFLTLVLVVLGVSLVSMSSVQHTTSAQAVQTARAGQAVRVGIEWAIWMARYGGGCPAGPTTLSPGGQLASFAVAVTCTRTDNAIDATPTTQAYYTVDVTASSGYYTSPDFVQRRGQAKVLGP